LSIYADLQNRAKDDPDGVIHECAKLLDDNKNDAFALSLMGQIYAEAERFGAAFNAYKRVSDIRPDKPEGWNNLGMACEGLKHHSEAMGYFRKAYSLEKKAAYASNIGNCYLSTQNYDQARQWARKALEIDPKQRGAQTVLAHSSLALGDWATGWDNYEASLGGKFRKETQYSEEGRWDGTKGQSIVVYGEQGLGDEIMYSSMVPDVAKDCEVILECDKRLAGLFTRSFPQVTVYGTRRQDVCPWIANHRIDARVPIAGLGKYYRRSKEAFPGTPYLVADPERVTQWKAILKRPTIGLCWSGGSRHNNPQARNIGLETLRPLIESLPNVDFVSLQYKDPSDEIKRSGLPVKHWKRATEGDDYDETAGLVSALDMVVGVHTSVHHLAGGLGVPGRILVPDVTMWNYNSDFPWYGSAKLVRQNGDWKKAIKGLMDDPTIRGL